MSNSDWAAKGTVVRGYLTWFETHGARERLRVAASSEPTGRLRALLDAPPATTEWIDGSDVEMLVSAWHGLAGDAGVRKMVHESVRDSMQTVTLPIGQGIMRLFGTSPAAFWSRMDLINRPLFRGLAYGYEAVSANEGVITVRFPRPVPRPSLVAWEGAFEAICAGLTNGTGSVAPVQISEGGALGRYRIRW